MFGRDPIEQNEPIAMGRVGLIRASASLPAVEAPAVETRKLAAILCSDVVGYSRLAGADEDRILARLRALRSDLIDPTIAYITGASSSAPATARSSDSAASSTP